MPHSRMVEIDNFKCVITKRKMKRMIIRIDKETGIVKVSVPCRVTYEEAARFVHKNIEWVRDNYRQTMEEMAQRAMIFADGETLCLWGNEYELKVIPSTNEKGVYQQEEGIVIYAPPGYTPEQRKKLVDLWYRDKLARQIRLLIPECCDITGKNPKEWRIRDMKTRWGTCNHKEERIWINLQLARKPVECLRYVMLHELTHLYVHNHGPEFWAYMDKFCPNWKEIRKKLNE